MHQKHNSLTRSLVGNFARTELSILGTTCNEITLLGQQIVEKLPQYRIGYIDSDHSVADLPCMAAALTLTDKISFRQLMSNQKVEVFAKQQLLQNLDLVLVNGNHHQAQCQVLVIDATKNIDKKLDCLTNVELIILKNSSVEIPVSVQKKLPNIAEIPMLFWQETDKIIAWIHAFMKNNIPVLQGLVLMGGQSQRMGCDKSLITYSQKTQRQRLFDDLSGVCRQVWLSCNAHQKSEIEGKLPFIEDSFLNVGPLGGILSAFRSNPNAAWLVVACDLPLLTTDSLNFLVKHRNPSKVATAFWNSESDFPEPLVTIWEPRAYNNLLQTLALGYTCPRKTLINADIELLSFSDNNIFSNVNTPDERERINTSGKIINS